MGAEVRHQLALKTKRQGDTQDYRVLACSEGPLGIDDFEKVFNRLSVGTMPSQARYEGENSPWITFGSLELSQVGYVAAIRQEWTERVDARSRPVAAMCCICLPYRELAEQTPDYTALSKQIPPLNLFLRAEKHLLAANDCLFPPLEAQWQRVARVIDDEIGFEYCADVAALLIQTPVALINGTDFNLDTRLSFLDAIISLLPYGARTDLHVSTWMYSASSGMARLGFTEAARQEQRRVAWGETPVSFMPADSSAKEYGYLLRNIRERRSTLEIVKALAGEITPLNFSPRHDTFTNVLRSLDLLNLLCQDMKTRQVTPDEVRRAFRKNAVDNLSEDKKAALLTLLIKHLEPQDLDLLRQHWSRRLEAPLCEMISSSRQVTAFGSDMLGVLYTLAWEKKWLGQYLEALLQSASEGAPLRDDALDLLHQGLRKLRSDSPQDAHRIRTQIVRQHWLLYEFAFALLHQSSDEIKDWFEWLGGKDQPVKNALEIIAIAAGLNKKTASLEQLRRLGENSGSLVVRLVEVANAVSLETNDASVLPRLIPTTNVWLLECLDSLDDVEREKWRELLPVIKKTPSNSELDAACADIVSLALAPQDGEILIETYLRGAGHIFKDYLSHFLRSLNRLGEMEQTVVEDLIRYCATLPFERSEENVNLLYLYAELISHAEATGVRKQLGHAIIKVFEHDPDLLSQEIFEARLKSFLLEEGLSGELFKAFEAKLSKSISTGGEVHEVAAAAADLLSAQTIDSALRTIEILDRQKFIGDPPQIQDFIEVLRQQLERRYAQTSTAVELTRDFHQVLLGYDSPRTELYRQYFERRLVNDLRELSHRAELLGERINENHAEEVSEQLYNICEALQLDKFYNKLNLKGFFRGLHFLQTKKK